MTSLDQTIFTGYEKISRLRQRLKKGREMSDEFIFVYGTLRKGTKSAMSLVLDQCCEYSSMGSMQGRLYEVDGYPGAIESDNPGDVVQGELYRINDSEKVLSQLDEYEECSENFPQPREYVRKKILISLSDKGTIPAWIYLYNHDTAGFAQIKNGDYLCYLKAAR